MFSSKICCLEDEATTPPIKSAEEPSLVIQDELEDIGLEIIRSTRTWIQYGMVGFAVICIVIGAVEGLAGR